jgi:hypothetical protein
MIDTKQFKKKRFTRRSPLELERTGFPVPVKIENCERVFWLFLMRKGLTLRGSSNLEK